MSEVTDRVLDPQLRRRLIKEKKTEFRLLPRSLSLRMLIEVMLEANKPGIKAVKIAGHRFEPASTAAILEKYRQALGDGMDLTAHDAELAGAAFGRWFALFAGYSFEVPLQMLPIPGVILNNEELCKMFRETALAKTLEISGRTTANYCEVLFTQYGKWKKNDTRVMPRPYKVCFDRLYGAGPQLDDAGTENGGIGDPVADVCEADVLLMPQDADAETQINVSRQLVTLPNGELAFMDEPESTQDVFALSTYLHQEGAVCLHLGKGRVGIPGLAKALQELNDKGEIMALAAMPLDRRVGAAQDVGQCYARLTWELKAISTPAAPAAELILAFLEQGKGTNPYENYALECALGAGYAKAMLQPNLSLYGTEDPRARLDRQVFLKEFRDAFSI